MEEESTYLKTGHDTKPENKDFGRGIGIQIILINLGNYKYSVLYLQE